jgi:mortality factor 4-like protein 1
MKLSVPEALKVILVDDWEAITKNNQVRAANFPLKASLYAAQNSWWASRAPQMLSRSFRNSRTMCFPCQKPCTVYLGLLRTLIEVVSSSLHEPALVLPTIISGLIVYFDRSLGANLLYRFERPQYADIRKQFVTGPKVVVGSEKEMSAVYGAEHLLRMLG